MENEKLIACCGLICSDCGAFKRRKCQGCHSDKPLSLNCKVKPCVISRGFSTCADCKEFDNLKECKKLNNFISKIFAFVFKSDRMGNLNSIRQNGLEEFRSGLNE